MNKIDRRRYLQSLLFVCILFSIIMIPKISSAHLDAGSDDVVNGYLIDFGYAPAEPMTLQRTILNFNLLNDSTQKIIDPTSLWIRITDKNDFVLFSGSFKPINSNVNFIMTFPKPGKYSVLARFYNNTDVTVEETITLDVRDATNPYYILAGVALIMIIELAVVQFRNIKKHRRSQ